MRIRRFSGVNVNETLRQVKEAMGEEALILARRDLGAGRVEITAAVDVDQVTAPIPGDPPEQPGATGGAALEGRRLDRLVAEMRNLGSSLRWIEDQLAERGVAGLAASGSLAARLAQRGLGPHLAAPIAARAEAGLATGRSLAAAVEEGLRAHLPFHDGADGARLLAFVGPTGSGKTTTIAKLAAAEVQSGRAAPGLIMADTQRVGAGDHLAAYARLLGAPLRTVRGPEDLPNAIRELGDTGRILIDTGGVSGDVESGAALARLLGAAGESVAVAAVLSATSSRSALETCWSRLERLAPDRCVVTKIDECTDPGAACGWAADMGLPLAWLGTGPRVPQDLCPADGATLARCLLQA
jgi:flagellar biosynthesis protein FlhF